MMIFLKISKLKTSIGSHLVLKDQRTKVYDVRAKLYHKINFAIYYEASTMGGHTVANPSLYMSFFSLQISKLSYEHFVYNPESKPQGDSFLKILAQLIALIGEGREKF